jgi:hypothetical protein
MKLLRIVETPASVGKHFAAHTIAIMVALSVLLLWPCQSRGESCSIPGVSSGSFAGGTCSLSCSPDAQSFYASAFGLIVSVDLSCPASPSFTLSCGGAHDCSAHATGAHFLPGSPTSTSVDCTCHSSGLLVSVSSCRCE